MEQTYVMLAMQISYIIGGISILLCVAAYFFMPKIIKTALSDDEEE